MKPSFDVSTYPMGIILLAFMFKLFLTLFVSSSGIVADWRLTDTAKLNNEELELDL